MYFGLISFVCFNRLLIGSFLLVIVDPKKEQDEALISMVVKRSQSFSIVDDCGFKESVGLVDATASLDKLRTRARKVVSFFKTSTTAKEKHRKVQEQMGCPENKLIQGGAHMLEQHLSCCNACSRRDSAALVTLKTDVRPLSTRTMKLWHA